MLDVTDAPTKWSVLEQDVFTTVEDLGNTLMAIGRSTNRRGVSTIDIEGRARAMQAFERLLTVMHALGTSQDVDDDFVSELRRRIHPVVMRSELFSRSFLKSHGFSGDFEVIEYAYDIGTDAADLRESTPALSSLLDTLGASVDMVAAVMERRQ